MNRHVDQGFKMFARAEQDVSWKERSAVQESDRILILVNNVRGDFATNDFAEDTVRGSHANMVPSASYGAWVSRLGLDKGDGIVVADFIHFNAQVAVGTDLKGG